MYNNGSVGLVMTVVTVMDLYGLITEHLLMRESMVLNDTVVYIYRYL